MKVGVEVACGVGVGTVVTSGVGFVNVGGSDFAGAVVGFVNVGVSDFVGAVVGFIFDFWRLGTIGCSFSRSGVIGGLTLIIGARRGEDGVIIVDGGSTIGNGVAVTVGSCLGTDEGLTVVVGLEVDFAAGEGVTRYQ